MTSRIKHPSNPSAHAADDAAARWAALVDAGPLSESMAADLARWCAEDPQNEALLERYLELLGRMEQRVPICVEAGQLAMDPESERKENARRIVRMPHGLFRRLAAPLAAAAALTVIAAWWMQRPAEFATTAGGRQVAMLEDGTRVDLNARTMLAVRISRDLRKASLSDGEVYFSVAKDPQRPFVIDTAQGSVRVTGTAFNLRVLGDQLDIVVVEGSVEVAMGNSAAQSLRAQEQLTIGSNGVRRRRLNNEQVNDLIAWRDGRVILKDEPLREAVARFSRYHNVVVDVADDVAHLELGGSFRLDQLNEFLRDIELVLPVHVLRGDGRARIVAR